MKNLKKLIIITLTLFLCIVNPVKADVSQDKELQIRLNLTSIKGLIDNEYYKKVDTDKMLDEVIKKSNNNTTFDEATRLFISELKDPYSEYYTLKDLNAFNTQMKAEYYGIGVEVAKEPVTGGILIKRVFDNSPAKSAKLKKGDIILKIDNKNIRKLELSTATGLIKGKNGTSVKLLILRGKTKKEITSKRGEVIVPTVHSEIFKDKLAYIRVAGFLDNTDEEFSKELDKLEKKKVRGLIIDLRDNGGGFVETAYNMLNRILPSDELVLSFIYKSGQVVDFITQNEDTEKDKVFNLPIVILINKNSASAAELFTGALVDKGLATTVGEKSFGKGVAQSLFNIFHRGDIVGGVKLTTINYYLPNGESINKIGIKPKYKVKLNLKNKEDTQLKKALKVLKNLD